MAEYYIDSTGKVSKKNPFDTTASKDTEEKEEKAWYSGYLQKGGETNADKVKGTQADAATDFWASIIDIPEQITDAIGTAGATALKKIFEFLGGAPNKYINYQIDKNARETIGKDIYDSQEVSKYLVAGAVTPTKYISDAISTGEWNPIEQVKNNLNYMTVDPVTGLSQMEKDSILGEKSDELIQSLGQMAATMALAPYIPWWLITGATSFGGEAESALNQGATVEQAALSGAISAGAEILSEKIGGITFGGKGLTDLATDALAKKVTSKVASYLLKAGKFALEGTAEGLEEVLSGYISAIGKKLTYMSDKEISEIFSTEEATDAFIGGFLMGELGEVTNVVQSAVTGRDYISGLTKSEQKVLDKVYEAEIQKQENSGKKLTESEKSKIYDKILDDMENGDIDPDAIEGALTDKKFVESIKSEAEEFDKLYNTPKSERSQAQQDRLDALVEKNKTNPYKEQIKAVEETVSRSVKGQLNGSQLMESYNEKARRGQAFEADLSNYSEKERAIVQKAMESGILNNTRKTHNFVDFVAKGSAKTGVDFSFADNQKLKESGFALEGKTVNGLVTKDGVVLNVNSAKALNTVVGHEITHVLEGTELYNEMAKVITEYAKSKGEYQSRYDGLAELYKDIKDANIERELVADLVGDYLFTDSDFVNRLFENRSLFDKVLNEIKYLAKIATAGSQEKKKLLEAQRAFERVLEKGAKNTAEGGVKYSIGEIVDENQNSYGIGVYLDSTLLDNLTPKERIKMVKEYVKELGGEHFTAYDPNGNAVDITIAKHSERFRNQQGRRVPITKDLTTKHIDNEVKQEAISLIDELIVTAEYSNKEPARYGHGDLDNNGNNDWEYWKTYIQDKNNTIWEATLNIANSANGEKVLYDINPLKKVGQSVKSDTIPTNGNISQNAENVNQVSEIQNEKGLDTKEEVQYSLSRNTEFSDKAIAKNDDYGLVDADVMSAAKDVRERIAARMNEIKDRGLVGLPEDIEGNTFISNSSYGGTEENTTICPRSLASEAFVDAVSEYLGRPLTVDEQIYISQDLQGRSLTPECTYCYVATDRKAYRAFLGEYIKQRDSVIEKLKANPNADVSRSGELYNEFLDGRKDTKQMYDRFKMWVDTYKRGAPMVEASDLANINKLMGDINSEFGAELKPQIVDAMKYAQSASWAKKRVNYVAYNGHILNWKQDRINKLNSHYGLRMYSFSDFHPAFVLENMQMITDASVRGLKMLGYTKDIDFVEIYAPSGMNINVSTFGFEAGGNVYENNIIGAEWEKAKELREKYPNVGITFVATNDTIVEWALAQDWIDVVIPYHLVRTGTEVAKAFGYTNYTSESADTKKSDWQKGDSKSIAPTEHNNDLDTYLKALEENHLNPRFERFKDNPNYMKLVNECRLSASESKPVQPVFNEEAAMRALAKLEANGYYQPIGGSVDRMYEIAAEVAEDMKSNIAPTKYSLSGDGKQTEYGDYNVYGKDIALEDFAPIREDVAAQEVGSAPVSIAPEVETEESESIAPDVVESNAVYATNVAEDDIAPPVNIGVNPQSSTGAAPSGFDPVSHLQYEYGSLPEGEHPIREDSLPKSTNGKDRVSLTARTVKGAEATPDGLVDLLDKETVGGRFSYIPIKNSDTVKKAYDEIVKKGWEAARGEWTTRVRRGEVSAELTATGSLLLNNAAKAGDRKAWLSILHDYQIMGTNAGQAVQAMRILKTLTPDDSLYMIERSIEQMIEDMRLKKDIVLDEKLKQNYLDAKTDAEKNNALTAIAEDVARQIPSTWAEKWTSLRYVNMLGNFRTQVRNIIGNAGMLLVSSIKNSVAAGIESLAEKASDGEFHRTKSLTVSKDQLAAAKNDFVNVQSIALNGGKFNDPMAKSLEFQQMVQDARRIFGRDPIFEPYRRLTNLAMDKGDLLFSKAAYARALAGYLNANGITETDYSKIDAQTLDDARAYAIAQAQEQTFRDNNWLSTWISKMGRRKDTPTVGKLISEGVMPFRKTPANILLRAEEYSPLGIANATVKTIQNAKGKGDVTGADVVDSWAKALTGTGLFALGIGLNALGILSGGADEDDDKEWFENQYGWQNYSLQLGDYNFTIDFFAPSAMPLLMGAQFYTLLQEEGFKLKDLESALLSIADPMIEMSMLQGVSDTLDNIRYAESNMGQFLINAGLSYLTQGLTNSLWGQLERSFDGQRMTTFVDKDSDMPDWLQKALGKASAKFPILDFQQIPYINAWGETEDIAPIPALLENTISPSYFSGGKSDMVYEELNRLNDVQSDVNVYPSTPDKTLNFEDKYGVKHKNYNLSADEYVELATIQGQTQKKLVEEIISNNSYSGLTDDEKAKAIELAYKYAREYSRMKVLDTSGFSSKWMAEAGNNIVEAIIAHTSDNRTYAYDNPGMYAISKVVGNNLDTYRKYMSDLSNLTSDKDKNGNPISGSREAKVIDYIKKLGLDNGQTMILYRTMYSSKEAKEKYDDKIVAYLNSKNISKEDKAAILNELGIG